MQIYTGVVIWRISVVVNQMSEKIHDSILKNRVQFLSSKTNDFINAFYLNSVSHINVNIGTSFHWFFPKRFRLKTYVDA
jgi:hypothetical protein